MIQRRTPLKRSGPPRKKRPTLRRGELTPLEKEDKRRAVYERDHHQCVVCHRWVIWEDGFWNSMHLDHIKPRGSGGTWGLENLQTLCPQCHDLKHHPKAVPPKVKE